MRAGKRTPVNVPAEGSRWDDAQGRERFACGAPARPWTRLHRRLPTAGLRRRRRRREHEHAGDALAAARTSAAAASATAAPAAAASPKQLAGAQGP